jgi:hypothetical protein
MKSNSRGTPASGDAPEFPDPLTAKSVCVMRPALAASKTPKMTTSAPANAGRKIRSRRRSARKSQTTIARGAQTADSLAAIARAHRIAAAMSIRRETDHESRPTAAS